MAKTRKSNHRDEKNISFTIKNLDQISLVLSTLMLLQSKINNTCTNFQIRHFFLIINQNVVLCREKQDESTCA